ncbi:ATP-binding protein [Emticicia sp. C21]|uniref:ATP-binding protein n=1 Tax=Emticicia sp. C21 TaxID=2302915 RepID=UPI000E35405D|nr:ATP-binding protein [Emticicia sp. C21]RFS18433.1 response regulator [Emticicia sp. C21]
MRLAVVFVNLLFSLVISAMLPMPSSGQKSVSNYLLLKGQTRFDSLEVRQVLMHDTADSLTVFADIEIIKDYAFKTKDPLLEIFADYLKRSYYLATQKRRKNLYEDFKNLQLALKKQPFSPLTEMFQANIEYSMGVVSYYERKQSAKTITHFLSADLLYRKLGYDKVLFAANKLSTLGSYYYDRVNDYDLALVYLREAEKYVYKTPIDVQRILLYRNIAKCLVEKGQYAEAIRYNKLGIAQVRLKKDSVRIGSLSGNIGEIILNHYPNPLEAEPYFLKELQYRLHYTPDGADDIAKVFGNLCLIEGLRYNREKVNDLYNKAMNELRVYNKSNDNATINYALKVIYKNRMVADTLLGDYKSAFHFQELYNQVTSELNKHELKVVTNEASARFESEKFKLQADLANEQAENSRFWILFISLLLIVVIVGAYYIYNYQRLKRNKLAQQLSFELKEAERLSELDILKTRFFANISHEFRTPLTLLSAPLSDFSKKYPNEPMFGVMQRNLVRLQNLINQILDLSKLEAGKMKPQIQEGDLAAFIRHLEASFESLAQSKNISFEYDRSINTYIACFDADKLEKIVSNLLSNAFKFTPEKGKIAVKTSYSDKDFTINIQDSGIGIETERLPFIFDRFYQVEDSTSLKSYTRNYEGTGIGLALVKELVDVLKGKIQVESKISVGTTFTITIPTDKSTWQEFISQEPGPTNDDEKAKAEIIVVNGKNSNPKAIEKPIDTEQPILLIIEDNEDLRAYIRSHFELSYQIIEAIDGQDGYEKALAFIPDLVICDLMMPRLDGFEFCKLVKSDIRTNHISVIMLTARAALEDRLEGLELGADDYLAKPFNTEELQTRVRNLINIRQTLQQKYSQTIVAPLPVNEAKLMSLDEQFLQKLYDIIDRNLQNTDFNTNQLADEVNMTAGQLRRKLKAITDQNIIEFIRNYRLQKAAILLQNKSVSVSDVGYQVGFENLSYFSKMFFETFGKYPSEWNN